MKYKKVIMLLFLGGIFGLSSFNSNDKNSDKSIYNFKVNTIDGEEKSLSDYEGKVVLIVNVASKCGFTPQYEGLQSLYENYKDKGVVILGFPCNQFGKQEPGTSDDIKEFCSVNYGVTFPMFEKIEVNGENAHPLYKYLKSTAPGTLGSEKIKWNFTKFLIDKNGKVVKRFASNVKPENISDDINKLI